MDEKRPSTSSGRLSGLPRPSSRLPLPRTSGLLTAPGGGGGAGTGVIRPSPSKEGLRGLTQSTISDIRAANPRLRASSSRDKLNNASANANALRKPQRSVAPPVSSQAAVRGVRNRSASREPAPVPRENDDGRFKRPLAPRRKQSGQLSVATSQVTTALEGDYLQDALPILMSSTEEGVTFDTIRSQAKQTRPSLSERTIETLSRLPSSPAFKRHESDFFGSDGARRPSSRAGSGGSRPGSSYQSDGSTGMPLSRPGSSSGPSDGLHTNSRAPTNTYKPPLLTVQDTPNQRTTAMKTPSIKPSNSLKLTSASSKLQSRPSLSASIGPRTPSPEKQVAASVSRYGSKTLAARPLKPRASIHGLFKKPSMSSLDKPAATSELSVRTPQKASRASLSVKSTATSGEDRTLSSASMVSTALTVDSVEEAPATTARKSSAALREQIAKAKAARRTASRQVSGAAMPSTEETLVVSTNFELSDDPFGQKQLESSNRKVLASRISQARTSGKLNIGAMGLKEIPEEVLKMYDLDTIGQNDVSWAETVDLTRFVAAGNELETIDVSVFPDIDPSAVADDEDSQGHQFAGLESLDLHGNTLISVPMGLRRLHQLTSLNLAQNKLANNCLEVISQISTLRDLKLGNNLLCGPIDPCFSNLENLEILDLRGNNITALPEGVGNLSRLRILNLNQNSFESLPFKSLSKLPLTELLAHKNKLKGTLIEADVDCLNQLHTLDVSANQLTLLEPIDTAKPVSLPSLHQLTLSMNRLTMLPDMTSWKNLLSLTADENSIAAIPTGFTGLEKLRHVDFTSNDIRVIPPEIARMDGLALLRITGNPLRDKKFTSLTTEELKATLALRLEPIPAEDDGGIEQFGNGFDPSGGRSRAGYQPSTETAVTSLDDNDSSRSENDDFATPPTSAPASPVRSRSQTISNQTWPIKNGGILDRSNTQSSSLHPVICSKIAASQGIREIRLQHNTFTSFPNSLSFFSDTLTSLSMSHNQLVGESFLNEELDLTALKELDLSHNHITGLGPLTTNLRAPNLQRLDVSCNRIVGLPVLRDFFPSLSIFLAANNHMEELDPDTIKGMKIVDASDNDIAHLNPRIGLLGGTGNLERLNVTGNRFRVPRWNVLDRGTEATLRWLRGRVPYAEMAEWRAKAGNAEEDDFAELD
ncbi:uncharacterized protein BCR38DRAFT_354633 [Pseudomassariella vexata]|uniref:Leucine-rich repeat-containing protein 40 n=1 Tax=Pseudomassariella vexata TaxID=1141098 RepID=A0A1Y2DER8_9PEZI|nr:uncharacterized protein BCR38DRAFT_354633 [Pseudomassariella vexata]ORY57594.1 hypothetical protein BCR38DRAFT_354633 [Pseudomassariella vexata]